MQQGMQQGLKQNDAQVLLRQLTLKFGELAEKDLQRIEQADAETLLTWSERILSADTLDEVWGVSRRARGFAKIRRQGHLLQGDRGTIPDGVGKG